jgi:Tfp pilus assembly protein PilF
VRRAAVAVTALALAGCGHGEKEKRATPSKEAKKRSATERALDDVRGSDLPEDAKRELEEAAELLEKPR